MSAITNISPTLSWLDIRAIPMYKPQAGQNKYNCGSAKNAAIFGKTLHSRRKVSIEAVYFLHCVSVVGSPPYLVNG